MIDIHDADWVIKLYSPATEEEIKQVEKTLQVTIPNIYKQLLLITNGLYGNLVTFYSCSELIEMNKTYEVQEYAHGYISIGNDHGGYHLLMRADLSTTIFQLVSDGYGVPRDTDIKDDFLLFLQDEEANPWRNEDN